MTTFQFEPPVHEESMRTNVKPLVYYRLTHADSVVRVGGVFKTVSHPTNDQLVAAGVEGVDWFIGGHVYDISAVTQAELEVAGFSSSGVGGYGQGAYGYGPYGS